MLDWCVSLTSFPLQIPASAFQVLAVPQPSGIYLDTEDANSSLDICTENTSAVELSPQPLFVFNIELGRQFSQGPEFGLRH